MYGSQMLSMIMERLGARTDPKLRSALLVEAVAAQANVLEQMEFLPWFLLSENSTALTVIGEPRLVQPANFLEEDEDGALIYQDADGMQFLLEKYDYDYCLEAYADSTPGPPESYALAGGYFFLFPTPDAAYTIRLRYFASDDPPTDTDVENKWLTHAGLLLLAETGRVAASFYIQNPDLAAAFTEEYKRQKELLRVRNESRLHTNRDYRMGGVA